MAVGNEDNDRLGGPMPQTDGWSTVDLPPRAGTTNPADPPRPGPELLEADTWGETPTASTVYSGRHTNRSRSRVWLAVGAGVAGLAVVVAIALAMSGSPSATTPPPTSAAQGNAGVSTSPSEVPSATARPSQTAAPTSRPAEATVKPTPKAAPFIPLTIEAEAGSPAVTLGGSALIASYDGASNGKIVRNIGDWDMRGGPGILRFNAVTFPSSGTYVLSIFFVHLDNESTRTARISVAGVDQVTVSFSGDSRCCATVKVSLSIPAGTRSISISNPKDPAPSIDKIVISKS